MTVTDAFACAIAGLLLVQAALRAKSAWSGRRRERSLWGAFAALAVSWLCRTSTVNDLLDATGIYDLGFLVKHATAIVGICVLLRYVTASTRTPATLWICGVAHACPPPSTGSPRAPRSARSPS